MDDKRKMMVRYAYTKNGQHKNTLVALFDGDVVFFGIARCNLRADTFSKKKGRETALRRAEKMIALINQGYQTFEDNGLNLHWTGLRGFCARNDIQKLKEYFFTLEQVQSKEMTLVNSALTFKP